MKKPKKDPIREQRIQNEAIVDAYGPEEQAMGWYYYLEDKIRFPFPAKCIVARVVSPRSSLLVTPGCGGVSSTWTSFPE